MSLGSRVAALLGYLSPDWGNVGGWQKGRRVGSTLCHFSGKQNPKGFCSSGRLSTATGRQQKEVYPEAITALGLHGKGRSFTISGPGGGAVFYILYALSHLSPNHPVSRITPVVYIQNPTEPPNEDTKGPLWLFLVFLSISSAIPPLLRTWGEKWVSQGIQGLCQERPKCSRHDVLILKRFLQN